MRRAFVNLLAAGSALFLSQTGVAVAQQAQGIVPQRDCSTIRTCRFDRGGPYRGCVSSYSCRACEFVVSNCTVGSGRRGKCQRLRCGWGA